LSKLTVGGLFSGVGGIELAFRQAGFDIKWANERDKYAQQTYLENFKDGCLYPKDIKKFVAEDVANIDPVDIIVAGFPCQAFSVAGYRNGFSDERGNIFFSIMDVIECIEQKPKVLFLENVKNFATHDGGKTLEKVTEYVNDAGYSVTKRVLNTSDYTEIPQNRERTFMVCFKDEFEKEHEQHTATSRFRKRLNKVFPLKPQNETNQFRRYLQEPEDPVDEKYYLDNFYKKEQLDKDVTEFDTVYQWRRIYFRKNKSNECPTLTANMGTGGWNVPIILTDSYSGKYRRKRKLTPRECFNLQGFPSKTAPNGYKREFKLPPISNTQLYKQAGNSVSVPLVKKIAKIIKQVIIP